MPGFDDAMNEATEDILDAFGEHCLVRRESGQSVTVTAVKDHEVRDFGDDGVTVVHNTVFTVNDREVRLEENDRIYWPLDRRWYVILKPIDGDKDASAYAANPADEEPF